MTYFVDALYAEAFLLIFLSLVRFTTNYFDQPYSVVTLVHRLVFALGPALLGLLVILVARTLT